MIAAGNAVDIYERPANALDAYPHGFARTPSGVEIRLIKMAFTEGPKRWPAVAAAPCQSVPELLPGKSVVDRDKCIGCGVCVIGCVSEAIEMVPVSAEEWFHVPNSMAEWEEMRLQNLAAEKGSVAGENITTKL